MLVRNRTGRSSLSLGAALAQLGRRDEPSPAATPVPLALAQAVPGAPGQDVLLGVKADSDVADTRRLVVWERCESDGDCHTVYLRGDLVAAAEARREASIVLRPRAPGLYRVVDAASGHVLHHFHFSGAG